MRKPKKKPARRMPSDRRLRAWIFDRMCNSDLEGKVLIANMEACLQWIKHGNRPPLRVVESVSQPARSTP
jgi:hypothetical protein